MNNFIQKTLFAVLLGAFSISLSMSVSAAESVYEKGGYAISGYDTVAYFIKDKAVKGKKKFAHSYKGATWLFSSSDNRDLFKNDPEKYAPRYNGWCAYAMSYAGKKKKIDPKAYTIKDNRLYLNFSKGVRSTFNEDIDHHIAQATVNWKKLLAN